MEMIAQIARYHRGGLPDQQSKTWASIYREDGAGILLLSGILRLASALANDRATNITRLRVRREGESVAIRAAGYREIGPFASHVAEARHLLEIELNLPVLVMAAPNPASA
jgi:exopolyphosphatase/pppGpp-phosphohydrolase